MDLTEIDNKIRDEINSKYAGYTIKEWASGMGGGERDIAFDIFLKDGSRFCVDAFYNVETGDIRLIEKGYNP